MHGLVTYLFAIPLFPCGPRLLACGLSWFLCSGFSWVLCFWFCPSPFVFSLTHTSRLASTARTLLGGLRRATFNFAAFVALLFLIFPAYPTVFDLAKQRRKMFWGVSEDGENDFSCSFCWLCVCFLVFFSPLRSHNDAWQMWQQFDLGVTAQETCADKNLKGVGVKHFAVLSHLFIAQKKGYIDVPPGNAWFPYPPSVWPRFSSSESLPVLAICGPQWKVWRPSPRPLCKPEILKLVQRVISSKKPP